MSSATKKFIGNPRVHWTFGQNPAYCKIPFATGVCASSFSRSVEGLSVTALPVPGIVT